MARKLRGLYRPAPHNATVATPHTLFAHVHVRVHEESGVENEDEEENDGGIYRPGAGGRAPRS